MSANRRRPAGSVRIALIVAISATALLATSLIVAVAAARPATRPGRECRVPHLTHLTVAVARRRAARAGCTIQLVGVRLTAATIQTVQRQSPAANRRAGVVTLWINPVCHGEALYGPGFREPRLTPGPTELVSGFYLQGGPLARFSSPGCRRPEPPPEPGTVEVLLPATGALVATQSSTRGRLVEIPLPPGTYKIVGTFGDAIANGRHATRALTVEIPSERTVRQDFILPVP